MTFPDEGLTFTEALEQGLVSKSDIDDWVEAWHFPDDLPQALAALAEESTLQEFLGFSDQQFKKFVSGVDGGLSFQESLDDDVDAEDE